MKLPRGALSADGAESYLAAKVPWHQDWGVLLPEADTSTILSCWIAVTDADEENGCLQVIPGTHRGDLLNHCPTDPQSSIPDQYLSLDRATPLPMRAGSAVFFERRLVHASLDNRTTDRVRISMDLRYQPIGQQSGRPQFPSFVARSKQRPELVLDDPDAWAGMWFDARARLAEEGLPKFTRWDADAPFCA
jgi:ectoine hydroxylase-related dioxygenase (phytanoyl-CoA dioxygenase family)